MSITVTGRKMPVTDALRAYAEDKIGNSMKVMDINPLDAEVVLHVEKNPANATPAICEVTLRTKGHIVRVEESEEDMYAAIDVAAAKVLRQLRKFKTRVVERRHRSEGLPVQPLTTDFADLIDEQPGDEDELVREKFVDLTPMTEEEALVQTDLIGHDFYVFTNATTGLTNVAYRRKNGGYGIIKPKIEEPDE